MKSDEERQERGDVLKTRQFGLVALLERYHRKYLSSLRLDE